MKKNIKLKNFINFIRIKHIFFFIYFGLLTHEAIFAQLPFFDDPGFNPHREYFNQAFNERIDPFTGNLILTYTDIFLPGNGGLDLKIQRVYNSKIYSNYNTTIPPSYVPDSWVGLGWSLHMGRAHFHGNIGSPLIEMPDGSKHAMYRDLNSSKNISTDCWIGEYVYDPGTQTNLYKLYLTDGTIYTFKYVGGDTKTLYVVKITDINGNSIDIEYEVAYWEIFIKRITDSIGRAVNFNYNTEDINKELISIEVNNRTWRYYYEDIPELGRSLLKEVKPPTGASWKYSYEKSSDPKYELTAIKYPTGANIKYTHATEYFYTSGYRNRYRVVKTREIGGRETTPGTWYYEYNYETEKIGKTTITDPANRKTIYHFFGAGYGYWDGDMWRIGLMTKKEVFEGSSLVEETIYQWDNSIYISHDDLFAPPFVGCDTQIYLPTLSSVTIKRGGREYSITYSNYDNYGNPHNIVEIGERTRTINKNYDHRSSFVSRNIIRLVKDETISGAGNNFQIKYDYDSNANLTSLNRYGVITKFTYFNNGNKKSETDANNNTTSYSNYAYGTAEKVTNPEYTILRDINFWGTINWEEDGRSNKTLFEYDALNRLKKIDLPGNEATINIEYANDGSWAKVSQGNSWTTYYYDGFGKEIGTQNSAGIKTSITYNSLGQKTFESLPYETNKVGDNFEYDALERLRKVTHSDGSTVNYTYSGNSISIKNERNITTMFTFESFGSPDENVLVAVVDPVLTTSYKYNILGSLIEINQQSLKREFHYNSKNFLDYETHPEKGKTEYTRDGIGNLKSKKDANSNIIQYSYDGLNRLKMINYPSGTDVEFNYDDSDNLIQMTDASGSYIFTYNANNRLTSKKYTIDGITYEIKYEYDSRGNIQKITYPSSGNSFQYPRDSANRITSVSNIVSNFDYHPSGGMKKITFANGITTNINYDPKRYWITEIKTGTNIQDIAYNYDNIGNVLKISDRIDNNLSKNFEYDALDRLIVANGNWGSGQFSYDVYGNRKTKSFGGTNTTYVYDLTNNRLTSTSSSNPDEVFSFNYDNNGNIVKNGRNTFEYNFENQIVTVDNGTTAHYIYDGQKRRVKKVDASGNVTIYHYDQDNNVIAETNAKGEIIQEFVYANNRILAVIKSIPSTGVEPQYEILRLSVDGTDFDGEFASSRPLIEAFIDNQSSNIISLNEIKLILNGTKVELEESNFDSKNGYIQYQLQISLNKGQHTIELRVGNTANSGLAIKRLVFNVVGLKIRDVLNYPNPFQGETTFTYVLTDYADKVTIKIYTISGRLIKIIETAPNDINFNQITWDGLDADGDQLANGVYLYKIIAKQGNEIEEKIQRLTITR